jgi:hypothetical protein
MGKAALIVPHREAISSDSRGGRALPLFVFLFLFLIVLVTANADSVSTGTGFFINQTQIVTCAHCVPAGSSVFIVRSDNSKSEATVAFADRDLDIAVLSSDRAAEQALPIGDSEDVKLLDDLYVFGFPLASEIGSELSASHGTLNSRRSMSGKEWLQLDATINPGNSGGPILNASGQVVGIAVARLDSLKMVKESGIIPERINFAIPSSTLRTRLTRASIAFTFAQPTRPITDIGFAATKATVLLIAVSKDSQAGSESPPPTPSQTNLSEAADSTLRSAATEYIDSGNSPSLDREMALYAERVEYYDEGPKTVDQIRIDLAKQRQKWTSRHFDVLGIVSTKYDADKDVGSVIIHYTYQISNSAKHKMGEAESLLVFENVSKEPRVILVKEQMVPKH